ncbi:MAG: DUF3037 domain-containing protein [Muribaculaceae bacterium]|nr:DUF3037 domain-containing protein [Muribaculaceae bacterium]
MHDRHLYEYAVIRYLPRVEREEFINVGLIMMCKRQRWIRARVKVDPRRLQAFPDALSADELTAQLHGFGLVASGSGDGGDIAALEAEERFRWLTAVRSACVQTSRPHPGLCADLSSTFDRLFAELVD